MAKRGAEEQITQDNPGDSNGAGSWGATSAAPKATAAQLANRRIAQPRGNRRAPGISSRRPRPPQSPAVSSQNQPQANGTDSASPGSFGQQQPPASLSFPPFGSANASGSSSFVPPSSSFDFGAGPSTNPFSTNSAFGGNTEKSVKFGDRGDAEATPAPNPFTISNSFPSASNPFDKAGQAQAQNSLGQPNTFAPTNPQQSTSIFSTPSGQANTFPGTNTQQSTSIFGTAFGQTTPAPSTSSQQNTTLFGTAFSQNNAAPSTSSQQNSIMDPNGPIFGTPLGQSNPVPSADSQQNSTVFGTAFSQPGIAAQPETSINPDAMMISPEKKATNPMGRSLFDRIEKPLADASSSPATTTTAPPPIFSFNPNTYTVPGEPQNSQSSAPSPAFSLFPKATPTPDSDQNPPTPSHNLFEDKTATVEPTAATPFTSNSLFSKPPATQSVFGETPLSDNEPRPSSPSKAGRKVAELKRHVEDKPKYDNPFSNLLAGKDQSSAGPSSIVSLVGSSVFKSTAESDAHTAAAQPGNTFRAPSITQVAGRATEGNTPESHNPPSTASELFLSSNSPVGAANASLTNSKPQNQDLSNFAKVSDHLQNNGNEALKASASASRTAASGRRASPPEHWSFVDKQQWYLAYEFKALEVGANAKRKELLEAKDFHRLKYLKPFYQSEEKRIWAEFHALMKPHNDAKNKKRSHDQQDEDVPSSSGELGTGHSVNHESSLEQNHDSSRGGKRVRITKDQQASYPSFSGTTSTSTKDQQVSYPSLSGTTSTSNTSSLFKNILDKPDIASKSGPITQTPTLPSKAAATSPSVLQNGNTDDLTGNPFAESIARWRNSTSPAPSSDEPLSKKAAPEPLTTSSSVLHDSNHDSSDLAGNPFADSIVKWRNSASPGPANDQSQPQKSTNASSNVFAFTPQSKENSTSKPPVFAQTQSSNFLAQFSQSSKARAKEEMEKRKAEDMDSDEDEAEWERRDAEEQRAKKRKLEQETSKLKPKFTPGQGFTFATTQGDDEKTKHDSGNEGSKSGDADDEQDGSDDEDDPTTTAKKPSGGSLFDRISAPAPKSDKDANNEAPQETTTVGLNIFGQASGAVASAAKANSVNKSATPSKANIFGKLPSSTPSQNVFGMPSSASSAKVFGSAEKGDNTWNPVSPIKFGSSVEASSKKRTREEDDADDGRDNAKRTDTKEAPAVNVISASPSKAPSTSLLFGTNSGNTFGSPSKVAAKPSFGTPTGGLASSFGFGISPLKPGPALGSLFPPATNLSNGTSRSNSPGVTTGESANESNVDGDDEETEKHDQLNLTSVGPGEEYEEVLYQVRAKASLWVETEDENGEKKGAWETGGLGPFRILKDRVTDRARILMRSDPTGRVILNSTIFKGFKYDAPTKSTCRVPILSEEYGLENWVIKVGKEADAAEMARILEANKDES